MYKLANLLVIHWDRSVYCVFTPKYSYLYSSTLIQRNIFIDHYDTNMGVNLSIFNIISQLHKYRSNLIEDQSNLSCINDNQVLIVGQSVVKSNCPYFSNQGIWLCLKLCLCLCYGYDRNNFIVMDSSGEECIEFNDLICRPKI